MTTETIVAFEELTRVDQLVKVLFQVNECQKFEFMDVVAIVQSIKGVIDIFINELQCTDRKFIKNTEDLFYMWLFDKVMKHGNDVMATNEKEKVALELETKVDIGAAEGSYCKEVGVIRSGRKNQFSQRVMGFDVEVSKPNFTAASVAFTKLFPPRCGQKFLELRDRVRGKIGSDQAASYYCQCRKRNDIYIQFRHHCKIDEVTVVNEKRYRYRCFVKPEKLEEVLQHFALNSEAFGQDNRCNSISNEGKSSHDGILRGHVDDLERMFRDTRQGQGETVMRNAYKEKVEQNTKGNRTVTRAYKKKTNDERFGEINASVTTDKNTVMKKSSFIAENFHIENKITLVDNSSKRKRIRREGCNATDIVHEDDCVDRSVDDVLHNIKSTVDEVKENSFNRAEVNKCEDESDGENERGYKYETEVDSVVDSDDEPTNVTRNLFLNHLRNNF